MMRMLPLFLILWVGAADAAASPGPTDAIDPRDLPGLAKLVSPEQAKVYQELSTPADLIITEEGLKLYVKPLRLLLPLKAEDDARFSFVPLERTGQKVILTFAEIQAATYWEERVLDRLKASDKPDGLAKLRGEEWLLRAALRFHVGERDRPLTGRDPWEELGQALERRLLDTRSEIVKRLPSSEREEDWKAGLDAARAWASLAPKDEAIAKAAADLHVRFGRGRLKTNDAKGARAALDWLEAHAPADPGTIALAKDVRRTATDMVKAAADLPDLQAIAKLQAALGLWPHAPDAAAHLAKRRQTYRVLYVALPELPRRLSPPLAATWEEKQLLDLLFAPLTDRAWHKQGTLFLSIHVPDQCLELPWPKGNVLPIALRADRAWSDGRPVSSRDVRHTYSVLKTTLAPRNPVVREFIETPRLPEQPFHLDLTLHQPLFDPLAPTRHFLLPERVLDRKTGMSRPLENPAGIEFASHPTGNGPFAFVGKETEEDGTAVLVFRANPGYPRGVDPARNFIGEVRFLAWEGAAKEKREPHVILRPNPEDWPALMKAGYAAPATTPGKVLHYLAVNHRRPALAIPEVRRALAHAVPRDRVLREVWNRKTPAPFHAEAASGPYEKGTWAYPPVTLLAANPFPKGSERLHARQAAKKIEDGLGTKELTLVLLHPENDARIKQASEQIAAAWREAFGDTGIDLRVEVKELSSDALQEALRKREYDLAWQQLDQPEDLGTLWSLLDDHEEAIQSPLGGNILGYRNDPTLIGLFRTTALRQPFAKTRDGYHAIHIHLHQTMPFLPLWHEAPPIAVHSALQPGTLDPRRVFQSATRWSVPVR